MAETGGVVSLAMYQGEDWSQSLQFFTDLEQTTPLVFADPVMEIRGPRGLQARFDSNPDSAGSVEIPAPGTLILALPWQYSRNVAAGTYPLDIFADVGGKRVAITKQGVMQLVVTARITQDDA